MYDYVEAMKSDIREYIQDEDIIITRENREEMEQKLYDDLWVVDSVTGNGNGEYADSVEDAKQYVVEDGLRYIRDVCADFGIEAWRLGEKFIEQDWHWLDVSIRCWVLGQALSEALDDIISEMDDIEGEDEE